jgi:two-component system sensor histidine kinase/response regulator
LNLSVSETVRQELPEEMLISKMDLLRILMDNMPDTIYFKDAKSRFLLINEAQCKILGVESSGEAFGKTDFDFFTPEHARAAYKDEQKIVKTGKPLINKIEKIRRADGQFRWVTCTKMPIKGKNGRVMGIVGISRDITELKRMEEVLRESEEKHRTQFEAALDAIFIADAETGVIINCNHAASELVGREKSELIGKHQRILHPPEETDGKFSRTFKQHLKEKEGQVLETQVITKEGEIKDVAVKANVFEFQGRRLIQGIFRDITERKRIEKKLAQERDLLEALMDNVPDAIYFKDAESRFTRINREHARWLGLKDPKDALGKTDFDFYTKEHARDAYADEQEIVKTGQPLVNKVEKTERPDGYNIWNSTTKVPIKRENGHVIGIVGISRDITDLRNTEDALRKSEEALRETNRLLRHSNVDLENYTYVVSHDLKAPLRAIKAFSTFLVEDYGDELNENAREYLQRITKAVSNMDALIEDLLLLSRVGRKFMEEEKVDLNCLLGEIVIDLEPVINKRNGTVKYSDLPKMQVPRIWMKQMFMNLIDNGMKYNKSENPVVEVSFEDKGEEYLFRVKDNGIGIDKKYYERIFNLFERLHTQDEYEGTGAGLAICRKIAEHLGGKIWVESEVGKGSVFYFALPKKISSVKEDHKE